MFSIRLSKATLAMGLLLLAVLALLLLSSVQIAGAGQEKKGEEPKKEPGLPLDVKGQLQDNDGNDPVRNTPCKTYMVKLKKGKTYVIDMSSDDFDAYLRLENGKGQQVAEDDDSGGGTNGNDAQIVYTPEDDDNFKVIATRFADGTGKYTVKIRELSYKTGKVQPLKDGQLAVDDKLTNDDSEDMIFPRKRYKIYSVKMTAGRTYTIDLVSGDFDAWLRLVDAQFKKLAEDDDGGGDLNSRIVYEAKTDGVYHIIATCLDGQLGNYKLTVRESK